MKMILLKAFVIGLIVVFNLSFPRIIAACNLNEVPTALGCIPTNISDLVGKLLEIAVGIGGGIAFLLILYGGFQILTSTGDPEKLNTGKEIIVSAITGLLMIIFSVLLLRVIGYDILRLPGFTP